MTALRCLLTVARAVPGGYCLLRYLAPRHVHDPNRWSRLVSAIADLAMSLTMITALWAARLGDRTGVLLTTFAVVSAWYLARAAAGNGGRSRIELLHKGVAMAAMFWMLLPTVPGPVGPAGSMPGMALSAASTGPGRSVSVGFAGYLALAAVWWLGTGFSRATSPDRARPGSGAATRPAMATMFGPVGDAGSQTLMAAAMSAALLISG